MVYVISAAIAVALTVFLSGVRFVRPISRGLVERRGKYSRFARPGFNWVIPGVDRLFKISIIEVMAHTDPRDASANDR